MKLHFYSPLRSFPHVSPCLSLLLRNYFKQNPKCNRKFIERMKKKAMDNKTTGWIVMIDEHRLVDKEKYKRVSNIKESQEQTKNILKGNFKFSQESYKKQNFIKKADSRSFQNENNFPLTNIDELKSDSSYATKKIRKTEKFNTKKIKNTTISHGLDESTCSKDAITTKNGLFEMDFPMKNELEERESENFAKKTNMSKKTRLKRAYSNHSQIIGFLNYRITFIYNRKCKSARYSKIIVKDNYGLYMKNNHSSDNISTQIDENISATPIQIDNKEKKYKELVVIIYELHVEEFFRSQGIGTLLIKTLSDLIFNGDRINEDYTKPQSPKFFEEDIKRIILFVDQQNKRAMNFYRKNGFIRMDQFEECEKYHCFGTKMD